MISLLQTEQKWFSVERWEEAGIPTIKSFPEVISTVSNKDSFLKCTFFEGAILALYDKDICNFLKRNTLTTMP